MKKSGTNKEIESEPLLSVIVPIYNVALYLEECLGSVLDQGFKLNEIEVVMINDGSTDGSNLIAERWVNRYNNFHLIHRENGGLSAARNTGLKHAHGKYIIFLDSDDIVPTNAYRSMYDIISKTGSDLIAGPARRFRKSKDETWPFNRSIDLFKRDRTKLTLQENPEYIRDLVPWNKMYRRDFFMKSGVRYPEGRIYEDVATSPRLYYLAKSFDIYSKPIYLWRVTSGGITQTIKPIKATDRLLSIEQINKFLQDNNAPGNIIDEFNFAIIDANLRWVFLDLWRFDPKDRKEIISHCCQIAQPIDDKTIRRVPQPIRRWAFLAKFGKEDALLEILGNEQRSTDHPVNESMSVTDIIQAARGTAGRYKQALIRRIKNARHIIGRRLSKLFLFFIFRPLVNLLSVNERMAVFSCYWGREFDTGCGPAVICAELMKRDPDFQSIVFASKQKYLYVKKQVDELIGDRVRVKVVKNGSLAYYYYFWRAKYLFNDVNFQFTIRLKGKFFTGKRSEQVEIETTHGIPLKTMGLEAGETPAKVDQDHFITKASRYDYLVSTSPTVAKIFANSHGINPKILKTGLPQNDFLFKKYSTEEKEKIRQKYGIAQDKKIILYAPTRRHGRGQSFPYLIDFPKLTKALGDEYQIVIKLHPYNKTNLETIDFAELTNFNIKMIHEKQTPPIILLGETFPFEYAGDKHTQLQSGDINELMLIADILITDYSSTMFCFAHLNKPMVFFTPDIGHYNQTRGSYFDIDKIAPGAVAKDTEGLIASVKHGPTNEWNNQYGRRVNEFKKEFLSWEKGDAAYGILKEVGILQ